MSLSLLPPLWESLGTMEPRHTLDNTERPPVVTRLLCVVVSLGGGDRVVVLLLLLLLLLFCCCCGADVVVVVVGGVDVGIMDSTTTSSPTVSFRSKHKADSRLRKRGIGKVRFEFCAVLDDGAVVACGCCSP